MFEDEHHLKGAGCGSAESIAPLNSFVDTYLSSSPLPSNYRLILKTFPSWWESAIRTPKSPNQFNPESWSYNAQSIKWFLLETMTLSYRQETTIFPPSFYFFLPVLPSASLVLDTVTLLPRCYVEFPSDPSPTFSNILQYSIPFPQCFHQTHPFKIVQHSTFRCILLPLPLSKHHSHLSQKLYTLGTIMEPIWTSSEHSQNITDMSQSQYNLGIIWNH